MRFLLPLTLLALAGCASTPDVHAPTGNVQYAAISHDPFWLVSIGDDRIVVTMGPEGGRADGELTTTEFPRVLPIQMADATLRWEIVEGGATRFRLSASPRECKAGGRAYRDTTLLVIEGRSFKGCGGPEVRSTQG